MKNRGADSRTTGLVAPVIVILIVLLGACAATPKLETQTTNLITESYLIPSRDPGIQLYLRNKHPKGMTRFSADRTLLYVHGATSAAEATFDLPLEGLSWMDLVALHDWDVYLVDIRGYGRSTRPPEMDQPAANNPPILGWPLARLQGTRDFCQVDQRTVQAIGRDRRGDTLNLSGEEPDAIVPRGAVVPR